MRKNRGPATWRSLQTKILITVLIIGVFRLGAAIPTPGINLIALSAIQHQINTGHGLSFLSLLSGGTLGRMALFTLGISPFVLSSMITQLLGSVFPSLKVGSTSSIGAEQRVTQYSRYLTLPIAAVEAIGLLAYFQHSSLLVVHGKRLELIPNSSLPKEVLLVASWVIGAAIVMWLAEIITQRGIGSGPAVLIFVGVLAELPGQLTTFYSQAGLTALLTVILLTLIATAGITLLDLGQRRIPLHYSMLGSPKVKKLAFFPIKLNKTGVMPAMFATAMVGLPPALGALLPTTGPLAGAAHFMRTSMSSPTQLGYIVFVGVCIVGFTLLFNAVTFDADDVAEGLARQGTFIHGLRPGPETADYIERVLRQVGVAGALIVTILALLPSLALTVWAVPSFPIAGTTMLLIGIIGSGLIQRLNGEFVVASYQRTNKRPSHPANRTSV